MDSFLTGLFAAPWYLSALVVLPVLWFLLRLVPPSPRRVALPQFFLLAGVVQNKKVAVATPLWLMILRMLIVALVIFAFARPATQHHETGFDYGGTSIVVVDNGWASAHNWSRRLDHVESMMRRLDAAGGNVLLVLSARQPDDARIFSSGILQPMEAAAVLRAAAPRPWSVDHAMSARELTRLRGIHAVTGIIYFSEGVQSTGTDEFLSGLTDMPVRIYHDAAFNNPALLHEEKRDQEGSIYLRIKYLFPLSQPVTHSIVAQGEDGGILDRQPLTVASGREDARTILRLPPDVRQKLFRIDLACQSTAATAVLQDARARRGLVGILSAGQSQTPNHFLDENYYIRKALETSGAVIAIAGVDDLITRSASVIIWADHVSPTAQERETLSAWVRSGGMLVRFAGPALAANPEDGLLPVRLRAGQRALQGAMTWEKPQPLGAAPDNTPFAGLEMPQDVRISRQVLAEADPDVLSKTWLQLDDGTPLVTSASFDGGRVLLVHTTAGPAWSDFCYSRLFVELLDVVQDFAQSGNLSASSTRNLQKAYAPVSILDGFGQLTPVPKDAPIKMISAQGDFYPDPETPPGLYAFEQHIIARNLGDRVAAVTPLRVPGSLAIQSYADDIGQDYADILLTIMAILFIIETAATFFLRGVFRFQVVRAALIFACLSFSSPSHAQPADAASSIHLAYIETGNAAVDGVSHRGLLGLMQTVNSRTSIRIEGVAGVNPSQDSLSYYPLIYWPLTADQPPLSATAAQAITQYMNDGGTILFDTRDGQFQQGAADTLLSGPGGRRLRDMAREIPIPELAPVERGHILTKSFYLLDSFYGLYSAGQLWVEKEPRINHDAISSVVIGANEWAAAWSQDENDRRRFPVTPGGERQREFAYRFGVNLMMMVLAGNYKSDQLHVPHILKRMQ
jgi:hypothetical protein